MRQEMHDLVLSSRGEAFHRVGWKWRQSQNKGKKGCFETGVSSKLTLSNAFASCFFYFLLVFLCKTKVDWGWCKTEICLFPPIKAKTARYPQPKSFLPLLTLGFFPPTEAEKIDEVIVQGVSEVFLQSTHEFLKNRKESLKFIFERSQGPTPGNQQT